MSTVALPQQLNPTNAITPVDAKSVISSGLENSAIGLRRTAVGTIDLTGRLADGIDWFLTIPKVLGGLASYVPMPAAKEIGSSVGAIFSGAFSALFHGGTVGAFKWLQFIRRQNAVDGAMADTVSPNNDVASASAKSFLSRIEDPAVRADMTSYVQIVSKLARIEGSKVSGEGERAQESKVLNQELASLEIKLARRTELNELKRLLHAPEEASLASEAELYYLATRMADKMISRVESYYKDNLGSIAASVPGEWSELAAQGTAGREALVSKIERKLLDIYLVERSGADVQGKLMEIRNDLSEAFKAQSAFREAVLYSVLGGLMYTGLLSTVISGTIDGLGIVAGKMTQLIGTFTPAWVSEAISSAVGYAEAAVVGVLGYMGIKSAVTVKSLLTANGESVSTRTAGASHNGVESRGVDFGKGADVSADTSSHADTGVRADGGAAIETLKAQLDSVSARTDTVASGLHQGPASHSAGDVAARVDVPATSLHTSPHMDLRMNIQEGVRIDPSVRVESIKVTPR